MTTAAFSAEGRFWRWVPVLLLGTSLLGWSFMVFLALDDPGFSVEPDYYKKSARWDEQARQRAANARLGWQVQVHASGPETVELLVRGARNEPLTGARVQAEAFAVSRASERHAIQFQENTPGHYTAKLPSQRRGLWEFRTQTDLLGTLYTDTARAEFFK